jgi:hypothetical protein
VNGCDLRLTGEVGTRSSYFEDPMVGTGGKAEAIDGTERAPCVIRPGQRKLPWKLLP